MFIDTTPGTPELYRREVLTKLFKIYDVKDRVLFGTDYPMWSAESEVERLLSLGLSESAYRKIFSENAIALFGL